MNGRTRTMYLVAIAVVAIVGVGVGVMLSPNGHATSVSTTTTSTTTTLPFNIHHNARADASTFGSCKLSNNNWILNGAIVNSAHVARKYQIIVDFVIANRATVVDTAVTVIPKVQSGARATWSVSGAAAQSNIACVIRNVQAVPTS